jgi:integrase
MNRGLATLRRALRLARQWRVLDRVPRIRLLSGELRREWVLPPEMEARYLAAAPQPLRDAAVLMLDTGLRVGEAMNLTWEDVRFGPGPSFGQVKDGKSRYAKRAVPLTGRVRAMLEGRRKLAQRERVFAELEAATPAIRANSVYHQHARLRRVLGLPGEFVVHSLRHTFCTRLGEAGAEAFLIQRMAGHYCVTVSER